MLILNPRLLVILGLIVGGAVLATRSVDEEKVREWKVATKADEVIRHDVLQEGELERAKGSSSKAAELFVQEGEVDVSLPKRELTAENLVAEVKRVSAGTPDYVPTVPLMGRLAESMMKEDPSFITFGQLDEGTMGVFVSGPNQAPKIVLSNDLKRMHDKGVPIAMIAPVLAHELDHFFWYLTKDLMRAKTHDVEKAAMVSTAAYIEVMKHGGPGGYTGKKKGGEGEAVDARPDDQEVAAYYKFLKKIRASLFGGQVDQLVKDHYGPPEKP